MSVTKILARDHDFHLNTGTIDIPDWVEINGVQTWTHSPQATDADTTTYDEEGRQSHMKASRGDQFGIQGLTLMDQDTGVRDPGQDACLAWADLIGPDSLKQFRITNPAGETLVFLASATVTNGPGGKDDASAFNIDMIASGAKTSSDLPALPDAPTAVAGTTASGFTLVSWSGPTVGSPWNMYEVVVFHAGVENRRIQGTEEPIRVAAVNGTAITLKVRARNAAGWGPLSAASAAVTPA